MSEKIEETWTILTAPFPLFLLILIAGTIAVTAWIERDRD